MADELTESQQILMQYVGSVALRLAGAKTLDEVWTRLIAVAGEDFWSMARNAEVVARLVGSRIAESVAPRIGATARKMARGSAGDVLGGAVEGALRELARGMTKKR